jgi:fimbrial chaperone protein
MVRTFRIFTLLFACLSPLGAQSGQFSVNPVRVELTPDSPIAVLKITNQGQEQLTLQSRTLAWDQNSAGDAFSPSRDVLATPPLFSLAPGAEQIVRVGMRRAFDTQKELTYRLFFEEVLPPPTPEFRGVRMALNVSLPVFAGQLDKFRSNVSWRLVRTPEGLILHAKNDGTTHMQARALKLVAVSGGAPVDVVVGNFYILPMKERTWPVKEMPSPYAMTYRLQAVTDAGKVDIELTPEAQQEK